MELWNKVKTPPANALKTIKTGRLKRISDINTRWRLDLFTIDYPIPAKKIGISVTELLENSE